MQERKTKFGGINDYPLCDKKIRALWRDMLRRCYDEENHKRKKSRTYASCEVCEEWHRLSNFARDIKVLDNYELWLNSTDYCLDKDFTIPGNKIYRKEACKFVLKSDNSRETMLRHKEVHILGTLATKKPVILIKDGTSLKFDSCIEASRYLGLHNNAVSKNYVRGYKCRGYEIVRI